MDKPLCSSVTRLSSEVQFSISGELKVSRCGLEQIGRAAGQRSEHPLPFGRAGQMRRMAKAHAIQKHLPSQRSSVPLKLGSWISVPPFSRFLFVCLLVAGCSKPEVATEFQVPIEETVRWVPETTMERRLAVITIKQGSELSALANRLDDIAIRQSSALQQLSAERANLDAAQFLRYPQLMPSASVPFSGAGTANVSVNLEQVVWDGGRNRSQIHSSEIKVQDGLLAVWEGRNQIVFDGLNAFADAVRFQERRDINSALLNEAENILELATARAESGVSDRGEALRVNGSINEIRRELLADTTELTRARTELVQLLEQPLTTEGLRIRDLTDMCVRDWPNSPTPRLARVELRIEEARINERVVRARTLPRVILQAGYSVNRDGNGSPNIGLQLDASDMLGLGRNNNVLAASALVTAADRAFQIERKNLAQELSVLEQEYEGSISNLQQLLALRQNSQRTIDLYSEQLNSGSISVVEGVSFYREAAQIERSIVDARHEMLVNCLQSSHLRGTLAVFKEDYNE